MQYIAANRKIIEITYFELIKAITNEAKQAIKPIIATNLTFFTLKILLMVRLNDYFRVLYHKYRKKSNTFIKNSFVFIHELYIEIIFSITPRTYVLFHNHFINFKRRVHTFNC